MLVAGDSAARGCRRREVPPLEDAGCWFRRTWMHASGGFAARVVPPLVVAGCWRSAARGCRHLEIPQLVVAGCWRQQEVPAPVDWERGPPGEGRPPPYPPFFFCECAAPSAPPFPPVRGACGTSRRGGAGGLRRGGAGGIRRVPENRLSRFSVVGGSPWVASLAAAVPVPALRPGSLRSFDPARARARARAR
eukprot:gene16608-biopygen3788